MCVYVYNNNEKCIQYLKESKEGNKAESVGRKGKGKMMQLYYNFKKIKFLIKDSHGGVWLQTHRAGTTEPGGTQDLTGQPA